MVVTTAYLVACGVDPIVAARRVAGIVTSCSRFGIQTRKQVAAYVAQCMHESKRFTKMVEDMNYSADRLMVVWPHRFTSVTLANTYAHAPELLANFVYGDRPELGNRGVASGDGWDYRGSGDIQVTGLANFQAASDVLGTDYVKMPSLPRTTPTDASLMAGWFWFSKGCNTLIEAASNIDLISKKINPWASADELHVRAGVYAKCYSLATD